MLRKLLLGAVLSATAVGGFALAPTAAEAADPPRHEHRHSRYEVMYRNHHRWECYGSFYSRRDAESVARELRHRGYQVRIENQW